MQKSEIVMPKKTWKKIRKGAKKKTQRGKALSWKIDEHIRKCPIKLDFEHDSKETIAEKWEQIKQWYKENPEEDPWKDWFDRAKLSSQFLRKP